jgi:hypothetical protein
MRTSVIYPIYAPKKWTKYDIGYITEVLINLHKVSCGKVFTAKLESTLIHFREHLPVDNKHKFNVIEPLVKNFLEDFIISELSEDRMKM